MENKNSFFSLYLDVSEKKDNSYYLENLTNAVDLILAGLSVVSNHYKFESISKDEIVYFFQTTQRKRKGQLVKHCERNLPENQSFKADGITKFTFDNEIERMMRNKNFKLIEKPKLFGDYSGNDIQIFNNYKNWHLWQKEVYNKIFDFSTTPPSFKDPDQRKIISIVDKKGNSGKSSFFKWMYYQHAEDIGRIGYGTAAQLRSSAVNLGKKKLYIVDLARSKSKDDRQEDLLSVLEDIKSGLVTNAMFGSGKTLLMEPPHIIVSSNYVLNYELLSEDRWDVYEINAAKKLKKLPAKSPKKSLSKKSSKES